MQNIQLLGMRQTLIFGLQTRKKKKVKTFNSKFFLFSLKKDINIFLKAIDNHSHLYIIANDSHYRYENQLKNLGKNYEKIYIHHIVLNRFN